MMFFAVDVDVYERKNEIVTFVKTNYLEMKLDYLFIVLAAV